MFSSRCAALLLALTACVTASFPNPLPCSGICTDTHDPTLIRRQSDGTYYRFATGGGMDIHTAPTLTGPWSSAGVVLPNGSKIDNSGAKDAWAPDVHHIEGEYVLYYAVSTFGTQESVIGVATSSTMATGTWTDHGSTGLQSVNGSAYNCIDPNLIVVNGTDYMSFGSFWSDIFQTTFRAPQALEWTSETPYQLEFNATSPQPSEGSYVFEADGWFYLFFSSGLCCGLDVNTPPAGDEYKVMVCRSRDVAGGYVRRSPVSRKSCRHTDG